jgi:uncharacterized protein (DUF1501 family)
MSTTTLPPGRSPAGSSIRHADRPGLDRRTFLQAITLTLGAAALGIDQFVHDPGHAAAAVGPSLPTGTPIVVVIDLAGGNDILNTIVPLNVAGVTPWYRSARPNIGITRVTTQRPYGPPPAQDYLPPALDLDGRWALHGALPFLANRWHDRGDVAIIQGTGENVVREMSHFAAFVYRWAGAFTGPNLNTGWLGRYNDLRQNTQPLGSIALGGLNQALTGVISPAVAIADLASFDFNVSNVPDRATWLADMKAMADPASPGPNKVAVAARALDNARAAMVTAAGVPRLAVPAGAGQLGAQLATAASLIAAGIPCQTYVATLGGFDDHASEPFAHWDQLSALDAGLAAFFALIDGTPRAGDVFVMLHSEFGRQVTQNAGQGTDHGLGSSTILLGGGVHGGLYGAFPDLTPSARYYDAMVATTDFRSVYATVLNRLGQDPALTDQALGRDEAGQPFPDLGVFSGTGVVSPPSTTQPGSTLPGPSSTEPGTTAPRTTMPASSTTMPRTEPSTTMPTTTTTMPTTTTTTAPRTEPTTTTAPPTTAAPTTTTAPTTTEAPTTTMPPVTPTLPAPRSLRVTSPRKSRLTVSWRRVAGMTYSLVVNGAPGPSGIRTSSVTYTGLTSGTVVTVAVVAHRGAEISPPSGPATVTIR